MNTVMYQLYNTRYWNYSIADLQYQCEHLKTPDHTSCVVRVVEMNSKRGTIEVKNPKGAKGEPPKQFTFDAVYDWE